MLREKIQSVSIKCYIYNDVIIWTGRFKLKILSCSVEDLICVLKNIPSAAYISMR